MTITLATLYQATAQEVFDQISRHLLGQMDQCANGLLNRCFYHDNTGLKCAAGCLISDDEYSHEMEDLSWIKLCKKYKVTQKHAKIIKMLQHVHDWQQPEYWAESLERIAYQLELKPN